MRASSFHAWLGFLFLLLLLPQPSGAESRDQFYQRSEMLPQRSEVGRSSRDFGFEDARNEQRVIQRRNQREELRQLQRQLDIERAGKGVDVEEGYERIDEHTIRR